MPMFGAFLWPMHPRMCRVTGLSGTFGRSLTFWESLRVRDHAKCLGNALESNLTLTKKLLECSTSTSNCSHPKSNVFFQLSCSKDNEMLGAGSATLGSSVVPYGFCKYLLFLVFIFIFLKFVIFLVP
jgi:hypothetical protein